MLYCQLIPLCGTDFLCTSAVQICGLVSVILKYEDKIKY